MAADSANNELLTSVQTDAVPREEQAPNDLSRPAPPTPSQTWLDGLQSVGVAFCQWLSRPRVRLTITGVILLVIGGVLLMGSVWTLPLVLAGALMVVVAWIGHRLEGRFAVEWGDAGTQLAFRAQIKPAQPVRPALPPPAEHEHADDTIDGDAHTVEIELSELSALLAAAEGKEGDVPPADTATRVARSLRVASTGSGSSEVGR
jgi:hypothetical protein